MSRLVDRTRTAVRTSRSHPLQIAGVAVGPRFGRIGVTFCPGKRQPQARGAKAAASRKANRAAREADAVPTTGTTV